MAYPQQPRFDPISRPPQQSHQLSYRPSREFYPAMTGYDPRSQVTEPYGNSRRRPPQGRQNSNEPPNGTYEHNENRLDQNELYDGGDGRYGARGQNEVGRWPPAQRPQGRPTEAGQNRNLLASRGRYRQQDVYLGSNQYGEPHGNDRHYQPEGTYDDGSQIHQNGDYGHDVFPLQTPDNWKPMQHFDRPSRGDNQAQQDRGYYAGHPLQDHGGQYNRRVPGVPASRSKQEQPISHNFQQLAAATNRTIHAPMMPDTVAWDNPFPTFPMRPSRAKHAHATGLDVSTASMSVREKSQPDALYNNRSKTASIKGSYAVPADATDKFNESDSQYHSDAPPPVLSQANPNNRGEGYFDLRPQPGRDAAHYRGTAQDRLRPRENGQGGARADHFKPINNGRHSEDSRVRPSLPIETRNDVGYERSRTMPAALSDAALVSGRPSHQSAWQEPGSIAGYHGPEDTGYSSISPTRSRQGSFPESRAYSDGGRPSQIDVVVHAQSTDSRQPHAQKDSLGDLFDTYFDATQDEHQSSLHNRDLQHRIPADEDMPKFNGESAPTNVPRREMTVDDHLQPPSRSPKLPSVAANPRADVRRDQRHDPSSDARHPRSRSQPNFKDRRSPRQPLDDGFDFGVPRNSNRPPATAPARHEYGTSANSAIAHINPRLDQYRQNIEYQGSTLANGHQLNDYNMANIPAEVPGQPPMAYQSYVTSERYRSPPLQNGRSQQINPAGSRPTPISNRTTPASLPVTSPSNPDVLPSHPAPVRPGLMQSSPVNQAPKPIPLRQYNATSSSMQSCPTKISGASRSIDTKRESVPVTHQELERLKQATTKNPEDQKTQLILAKKMVEAASVLVDERTDPRTRSKSREKYILDAHKIVKKLSNNGYSEATFYLADAYSRGSLGLESDTREAFKLYQAAAKTGHAQAAYRVAVCCEIGHEEGGGTSRDAVKAMQWYKRAATLGDTPAMYKMGIISLKGLLGQPKNPKEAVVWLKRAAERADEENPHALHELALLHEKPNNNEGVTRDEAYSKRLFAEAAELGYKFSQFRLGCAYEYGLMGCPVDSRQSIAWYSKAAVQGEHQSELALSGWYLTGSEGVLQQSDTEAYLWARKAAQSGLAKAEYAMGYFTEVGIGAPANLEDAKRWYWKSASQGFEKARGRLEELRRGNPAKQKTRVSRSAMRKNSEGECTIM